MGAASATPTCITECSAATWEVGCEEGCLRPTETTPVITYQVNRPASGHVRIHDEQKEYDVQTSTADFFGRLLTDKEDLLPKILSSPGSLLFRRAPFEVVLKLGRENILGLLVTPDVDPGFLVIDDIFVPSVASEWNCTHEESLHLRVGDTITSVNGVTGDSQEMLSQMRLLPQGAEVRLVIKDAPPASKIRASKPPTAPHMQWNLNAGEAWIPVAKTGYACGFASRGEHAPPIRHAPPDARHSPQVSMTMPVIPDAKEQDLEADASSSRCGLLGRVRETLSAPAAVVTQDASQSPASAAPADSRSGLPHFVAPIRLQY
mmetsp:Transcript_60785/g.100956  ORF Transcript_60785/g.100956 Transcript_60785/m.100956 type:complete len:319 (+) Transcript_60785:72-1028(+)